MGISAQLKYCIVIINVAYDVDVLVLYTYLGIKEDKYSAPSLHFNQSILCYILL